CAPRGCQWFKSLRCCRMPMNSIRTSTKRWSVGPATMSNCLR
ncbi:hypothetical protein T265_16011, partial [Opisthorchis viverrini]